MFILFKQIVPLSLILAARFFGLFVVMPLLALHALSMQGATHLFVGIAIGGYALTQVLLQTPFGILSDKLGRKKVITFGLLVFALGSLVCALSEDIYWLVIGRLLQGAGAIGGVVSAMIADLVYEEQRTKAMAIMGGIISLSFMSALIVGPIVGASYGVNWLFWMTFVLALCAIVVLIFFVPQTPSICYNYQEDRQYWKMLTNKNLAIMNLSNFLQKAFMTLAFLLIPITLVDHFHLAREDLYLVYIPASILGFLAMAPASILAEKRGWFKGVMAVGIVLFMLAYAAMLYDWIVFFILGVLLFFIGFSVHEPIMQSLASRYCQAHQKGAAIGIFTSFGYFGSFCGALIGGHFFEYFGVVSIGLFVVLISVVWLVVLFFLSSPHAFGNFYHALSLVDEALLDRLKAINSFGGVIEWYVNLNQKVLVVKYDKQAITKDKIEQQVRELLGL